MKDGLLQHLAQKCEAVPSGARISGSRTCESLNSRIQSNKEEEEDSKARILG